MSEDVPFINSLQPADRVLAPGDFGVEQADDGAFFMPESLHAFLQDRGVLCLEAFVTYAEVNPMRLAMRLHWGEDQVRCAILKLQERIATSSFPRAASPLKRASSPRLPAVRAVPAAAE